MKLILKIMLGLFVVGTLGGAVGASQARIDTFCASDLSFKDAPINVKLAWIGMIAVVKYRESEECKNDK